MDYIPRTDGDFLTWEQNFLNYAAAHDTALGLVMLGDITPVATAATVWEAAYVDHGNQQAAALAARQLKDDKRALLETALRALVRRLQASAAVSDDERAALGITVRDTVVSAAAGVASRPVLQADTSKPGQITVAFADEGTPTKKAKPAGVTACLLQFKKGGTAPAADADWQFLGLDSATPYLAAFDSADAGEPVWIRACWINSRQEQGPWSATLSTRVPG